VAGNVADMRAQVISAAAAGLNAAAAINADLIAEDVRRAVAAHRAMAAHHAVAAHRGLGEPPATGSAMTAFDEQAWEERYRSHAAVWSGRPNPQLVTETTDLTPGKALDAGCGEGADALWLAERGWQVTAVDFSAAALQRGAAHAAALGPEVAGRIRWVHADLTGWAPADGQFDLVSAQFMHLPAAPRQALFARLAAAVAPGGTLLIVGHHPDDLQTVMHRPSVPDMFFTAEDIARSLDPGKWDIVTADSRPRSATDPERNEAVIHDAVLRARKHAETG
jgi:SAM-dependent methyltransferase